MTEGGREATSDGAAQRPRTGLWDLLSDIGRLVGYASAWTESLGASLDSLNEVVFPRVTEAEALRKAGFHGPAIVSAYSAIELTLGLVVIRPFVLAGFLTDDLAAVFADQILRAPGREHRRMVGRIAELIGVDLSAMRLPDGTATWAYVTGPLPILRNKVVHQGAVATAEDADRAIQAAAGFVHDLALPLFAGMYPDAAGTHGQKPVRAGPYPHPLAPLMKSFTDSRQTPPSDEHVLPGKRAATTPEVRPKAPPKQGRRPSGTSQP